MSDYEEWFAWEKNNFPKGNPDLLELDQNDAVEIWIAAKAFEKDRIMAVIVEAIKRIDLEDPDAVDESQQYWKAAYQSVIGMISEETKK